MLEMKKQVKRQTVAIPVEDLQLWREIVAEAKLEGVTIWEVIKKAWLEHKQGRGK